MSVKHVLDYYNQVGDDYLEMRENLKDMEEALANKLVTPEQVEQIQQMLQPLMVNYQTSSYIVYLLKLPRKEVKKERDVKLKKRLLELAGNRTQENVLKEDKETIELLKQKIAEEKADGRNGSPEET